MASSFPRVGLGGAVPMLGKRVRPGDEVQQQQQPKDTLFGLKRLTRIEVAPAKGAKKGAKRSSAVTTVLPTATPGKDATQVDPLSFTKYSVGSLAMGYVLHFTSSFVVISLPGGVTGTVALEDISDTMHQLCTSDSSRGATSSSVRRHGRHVPTMQEVLSLMQPVRCYVKEASITEGQGADSKKKKTLVLSLRSSLVNRGLALKHLSVGFPVSGCVSSLEDHGYVISAGVSCTFFLPFARSEADGAKAKDSSAPPALVVGQPVECLVQEVNMQARSVTLRTHRSALVKALVHSTVLPFNAMFPGMKLLVQVDAVVQNGLRVKFLDQFYGVVDSLSLPMPMSEKETRAYFTTLFTERSFEARIVFIDHGRRLVRFSMRPHVVELRPPEDLPTLGSVVNNATVKLANRRRGVLLCLATEEALADVELLDVEASQARIEAVDGKKGAKLTAAADKRRRDAEERLMGVFVHKSALAEIDAAADDDDEESDDSDEDDDEDEQPKKKAKGKDKGNKAPAAVASQLVDDAQLERQYSVGTLVKEVRVLGYHLVEGFVVGSTMNLSSKGADRDAVFHWSQIATGQVLRATIFKVQDFGLVVKLAPKIKAVCPALHVSEIGMTSVQMKKKFKSGQAVRVRVWETNERAIIVTNKKSLVEDADPLVRGYDDMVRGRCALGVVSKVSEEGLKVHFSSDVKGLVTMPVLVQQGVMDVTQSYRLGQVVRCAVVLKTTTVKKNKKTGLESTKHRVFLALAIGDFSSPAILALLEGRDADVQGTSEKPSTSTSSSSSSTAAAAAADSDSSSASTSSTELVSGVVYKIEKDALAVRLTDGRLATLHKNHCADFAATADVLFPSTALFAVGAKIDAALVLSTVKKVANLTIKPLLLAAARSGSAPASSSTSSDASSISLPSTVTELVPGQLVAGFVAKLDTYGVLVRFRESLTALVPRPNVADKFVATPEGLFRVGDAVRCVVQRVDLERERVIATFKSAVVAPSSGDTCFLGALLRESCLAARYGGALDDNTLAAWQGFHVSQVVRATVVSVESYGVVLCAADQITMMLARGVHAGLEKARKQLVPGKTAIDVAVLDFDSKNKVLEVSMDESLLAKLAASSSSEASSSSKTSKKRKPAGSATVLAAAVGTKLQARVELVKERYLVVSVAGAVAYVMVADYHCPHVSCTDVSGDADHHFKEHQEISAVVVRAATAPAAASTAATGASAGGWHDSVAVLTVYHDKPAGMMGASSSSSLSTASAGSAEDRDGDRKAPEVKFMESLRLGAVFPWTVVSVSPLEVVVRPYSRALAKRLTIRASVHITGAVDHTAGSDDMDKLKAQSGSVDAAGRSVVGPDHPFFGISVGDKLLARIIQLRTDERDKGGKGKGQDKAYESIAVYLSTEGLPRPSPAAATEDEEEAVGAKRKRTESVDSVSGFVDPSAKWSPMVQLWGKSAVRAHSVQAGVVTKIEDWGCIVSISPYISARLHFLDVSSDIAVVRMFRERCFVGLRVVVAVTGVLTDATTGRPKSVSISRLPVEKYLLELGVVPAAAAAAEAKGSKKKAKKAQSVTDAPASSAAAVNISALNKVAASSTNKPSAAPALPAEGSVVTGVLLFDLSHHRIRIPQAPAVLVSLGAGIFGRVCLTELADPQDWTDTSALVAFMTKTAEQSSSASGAGTAPSLYGLKHGDFVACRVLPSKKSSAPANAKAAQHGEKQKPQFVNLSLRPSRVTASSAAVAMAPDVLATEGAIVKAFVMHTSTKGCFLRLSDVATGQVFVKDLSDEFVADPAKAFPAGMLVQAHLLSHGVVNSADAEDSSPAMPKLSLKASAVEGDTRAKKEIAKIKEGSVVEGVVQRVATAGVFVQLKGTCLVGLSRKPAAVSDEDSVRDLSDFFKPGDLVRARVISVSTKSKKIALGLRASYFSKKMIGGPEEVEEAEHEDEEEEEGDDEDEDDDEEEEEDDEDDEEEDDVGNHIRLIDGDGDSDDEEMDAMIRAATIQVKDDGDGDEDEEGDEDDAASRKQRAKGSKGSKAAVASASFGFDEKDGDEDDESESEDVAPKKSGTAKAVGLQFQWGDFLVDADQTATKAKGAGDDEDDDEDEDDDDDEDDDEPSSKRMRTKAKEALRRRQEVAIRRKESALVDGSAHPEKPKDFERLLLAEPRSSVLWMRYMALHLMEADIDAARAIAERALRTIDFREEEEKMNVWIAFVNLEHKYGSMDSLNAVFKRAVAESRGKYIHLNLAEAYEKADDTKGATAIYEKALKKYKTSKKVWSAYQQFKLRTGDHVAARALLGRSMQSLSRHKHVEVLLKYASAEFDFGSGDRGRSVFEELVASYPKRTDLWHVYVDKEIKCGFHDRARQLFERMIASKANPRNIKTVFKKYMTFEQLHGSAEQQEGVKSKAREYVQQLT